MTETNPPRKQALTPCLIGRGLVTRWNAGQSAGTSIGLHDRADPCGHLTRHETQPILTFVEWVEEWAEDYPINARPCRFCGGSL